MAKRKINMGMVGGGPGSFFGRVHYMAAILDGQIELVCSSVQPWNKPNTCRHPGGVTLNVPERPVVWAT